MTGSVLMVREASQFQLLKTWLAGWGKWGRTPWEQQRHLTVCFASRLELQGCWSTCRCGCSSCLGTAWAAGSSVSDCSICGQISGRLWSRRSASVGASWASQWASCMRGAPSGSPQSVWIRRQLLNCPPRHSPCSSPPSASSLHPPD